MPTLGDLGQAGRGAASWQPAISTEAQGGSLINLSSSNALPRSVYVVGGGSAPSTDYDMLLKRNEHVDSHGCSGAAALMLEKDPTSILGYRERDG